MQEREKVPLTVKALLGWINHRLALQNRVVKKARSQQAALACGPYYLLDYGLDVIVQRHVDLIALGQTLRCIASWEQLIEREG